MARRAIDIANAVYHLVSDKSGSPQSSGRQDGSALEAVSGGAVASAIAGLLPLTASTAAARQGDGHEDLPLVPVLSLGPGGWIHYGTRLDQLGLPNTKTHVNGVRDESGACVNRGNGSSARNVVTASQRTIHEEVAYNPLTCESVVATATLSSHDAGLFDLRAASQTSESLGILNAAARIDRSALTTYYSRWVKTEWVDPIFIVITAQRAQLEWTGIYWNRYAWMRYGFQGCVSGFCIDPTVRVLSDDRSSLTSVSNGWQYNAKAHFVNVLFEFWVEHFLGVARKAACGWPNNSRADFWHTDWVSGYRNGTANWGWNDSKSGACTNLVHHNDHTRSGYP